MAKKKGASIDDIRSTYEPQIRLRQTLINLDKEELSGLNSIFNVRKKLNKSQEILNQEQGKLNDMVSGYNALTQAGERITAGRQKKFEEQFKIHLKTYKLAEKDYQIQRKKVIAAEQYAKASKDVLGIIQKSGASILKYLVDADVQMKNLNLALGLSGERSAEMSANLSAAAPYSARLGVDMKSLAQMTATYADETGRARLLNQESLESISLIAEGTNLGAEGAARMAGQYEMMGFNATDTASEVQRIVDTTERMGVNTGKVLKAVGSNFKKLQKYSFKNGVKSMADMAIYASKFKMDMNEVFEPMEKGRRLDSVIEMSAQLQVLGGQFSNLSDPLSMLFESRNDPEAYMKRINEMTKGMVTLNKTAEGFEFSMASPMAKDQLAQAAKALGMSTEELTTQAYRMAEIQKTRSQMFSKGFTSKEKEVIEGLAKFDKKSGKMIVDIGGTAKHIEDLTRQDIKALEAQKSTLEDRALASQGFDEAFKNIVMELKASFLPLLKTMNTMFSNVREFITPLLDAFSEGNAFTNTLITGSVLLGIAAAKLGVAFVKGKALGFLDAKGLSGTAARSNMAKGAKGASGAGAARGAGSGMLKGGLGIGGAALGIGAGIGLAALGISKLADSMAKLDKTQIWALPVTITALAVAIAAFTVPMVFLGPVLDVAALGLLAFGAAALGIGAGIGLAAAGIGYMGEGLSNLDKVDLSGAAVGILGISAAAMLMGNPMTMIGMGVLVAGITAIGLNAGNLERISAAFTGIGAAMKGSSSDFAGIKDTIDSISNADVDIMGIAMLTSMLSKPLKVEFADKEIAMIANIDVSIGGSNFMETITKEIPITTKRLQEAK